MDYTFLIAGSVLGTALGFILGSTTQSKKKVSLQKAIDKKLRLTEQKVKAYEAESEELKSVHELRIKSLEEDLAEITETTTKRIELKEQSVKKREEKNAQRSELLEQFEQQAATYKLSLAQKNEEMGKILTQKSGVSPDKAKETLADHLAKSFEHHFEVKEARLIENTKECAPKQAIQILKSVMQKYVEPSSVDHLDKTLKIPHDIIKGKLIGKDGVNITYLEEQIGVDIVFEHEPGHVTVTCFNLVSQEIARMTIKRLFKAHDINHKIIDEALADARAEMSEILLAVGTEACQKIGIKQNDPEFLKLVGRLKYRTSYGQNILYHSYEIAYFSALMAAEIGADIEIAKVGGFLHDLGKAIDQEVEGSHDQLSKEIMERFGFSWEEVHAAWTHHDAIPIETVEAQIVKAADAISAGRPGARTESAQMYIERIQGLERLALETTGVKKAFALSAGREIRTIVDELAIKDEDMQAIAETLADQIEDNLKYPGKIKVNLIRSVEAHAIAKHGAKTSGTKN